MNKKAQFGPDVLIGFLLIAVLGLGGVFFLNVFVNNLTLKALLGVLDVENDQKCFFMLSPMIGDDYIRRGVSVENLTTQNLKNVKIYFGGNSIYEVQSIEFNNTINSLSTATTSPPANFPARIVLLKGFLSTFDKSKELIETQNLGSLGFTHSCSTNIYGPHEIGTAQLYVTTTGE